MSSIRSTKIFNKKGPDPPLWAGHGFLRCRGRVRSRPFRHCEQLLLSNLHPVPSPREAREAQRKFEDGRAKARKKSTIRQAHNQKCEAEWQAAEAPLTMRQRRATLSHAQHANADVNTQMRVLYDTTSSVAAGLTNTGDASSSPSAAASAAASALTSASLSSRAYTHQPDAAS